MTIKWYSKGAPDFEQGYQDAMAVRTEVFIREQGFQNEADEIDPEAHHIVVSEGDEPVATARIYTQGNPEVWHIGRVAALARCRGMGLGALLMGEAECRARALGAKCTELSAQLQKQGFYERFGYQAAGDVYYDEYCPHIEMKKDL